MKRLRARVDELKKDLAKAEDEVDGASNNMRWDEKIEIERMVSSLQDSLSS